MRLICSGRSCDRLSSFCRRRRRRRRRRRSLVQQQQQPRKQRGLRLRRTGQRREQSRVECRKLTQCNQVSEARVAPPCKALFHRILAGKVCWAGRLLKVPLLVHYLLAYWRITSSRCHSTLATPTAAAASTATASLGVASSDCYRIIMIFSAEFKSELSEREGERARVKLLPDATANTWPRLAARELAVRGREKHKWHKSHWQLVFTLIGPFKIRAPGCIWFCCCCCCYVINLRAHYCEQQPIGQSIGAQHYCDYLH